MNCSQLKEKTSQVERKNEPNIEKNGEIDIKESQTEGISKIRQIKRVTHRKNRNRTHQSEHF